MCICKLFRFIKIHFRSSVDENTKDVWPTEKEGREKQEYMNIQHGNYKFVVPCLELPKTGLDNLEGEQHYDHANINGSFSSFADNDQAKEDMKPVDSCGFQFSGRMNELLVNHHEASGSKKSRDSENGENLLGTCQEGNLYVSECPPSCSSSGRVLNECPLNLQINSCKVDQKTPEDYKESNGDEQPCPSESFSQFSHGENYILLYSSNLVKHQSFTNGNTVTTSNFVCKEHFCDILPR